MSISGKGKKPKAAYVEWIDSCSNRGWGMFNKDEDRPIVIRSVGILVYNRDHVTLSTSIDPQGKIADPLSIPRCAIRRIKRIKYG